MNLALDQLTAQDIMTPNPVRVDEHTPVESLFRLVAEHQLYCVPVVDNEDRLLGCIFESDMDRSRQLLDLREYIGFVISGLSGDLQGNLRSTMALDGPLDLSAREIMSVRSPRVQATTPVGHVCAAMLEHNTHHALVLDEDNHVIGLIKSFDILRLLQPAS